MPNGMEQAFRELVLPRVEETPREEASKLVLEGMRSGRHLGDAIQDAIESLPASKTKRLRSWIDQLSDFEDWIAYAKAGWRMEESRSRSAFARPGDRIFVVAPSAEERKDHPSSSAVAAAAGAGQACLVGTRGNDMLVYEITKSA